MVSQLILNIGVNISFHLVYNLSCWMFAKLLNFDYS